MLGIYYGFLEYSKITQIIKSLQISPAGGSLWFSRGERASVLEKRKFLYYQGEMKPGYISRVLGNNALITLMCGVGVGGISYGMLNDDNVVFIIGVLFAIAGYLLIRRKLKQHIRENL